MAELLDIAVRGESLRILQVAVPLNLHDNAVGLNVVLNGDPVANIVSNIVVRDGLHVVPSAVDIDDDVKGDGIVDSHAVVLQIVARFASVSSLNLEFISLHRSEPMAVVEAPLCLS